jgi:hypothetical protein
MTANRAGGGTEAIAKATSTSPAPARGPAGVWLTVRGNMCKNADDELIKLDWTQQCPEAGSGSCKIGIDTAPGFEHRYMGLVVPRTESVPAFRAWRAARRKDTSFGVIKAGTKRHDLCICRALPLYP